MLRGLTEHSTRTTAPDSSISHACQRWALCVTVATGADTYLCHGSRGPTVTREIATSPSDVAIFFSHLCGVVIHRIADRLRFEKSPMLDIDTAADGI